MFHLYRSTTNKQVCKTVFLTSFTDYNVNVIIDIYICIGTIIRAMSNIHNQGYKKCIWYWINKSNKLSLLFQDVVLPTWYGNFGTAHGPGVSNQFRLIDFKRVGVGEIRRHTVQCRAIQCYPIAQIAVMPSLRQQLNARGPLLLLTGFERLEEMSYSL